MVAGKKQTAVIIIMLRLGANTEGKGKLLPSSSTESKAAFFSVNLVGLMLSLLMQRLSLMFWYDLSTIDTKMCDSLLA